MSQDHTDLTWQRRIHEVLFSLNVGWAGLSFAGMASAGLRALFNRADMLINEALNIRPHFTLYSKAALLATPAVAFCLWLLLRVSRGTTFARVLLRFLAGPAALFAMAAFWVREKVSAWGTYDWYWQLRDSLASFELVVAFACVLLFLQNRWREPAWATMLLLAFHYGFWFWQYGAWYLTTHLYVGPAGHVLGFCAAIAWGLFVRTLRPTEQPRP